MIFVNWFRFQWHQFWLKYMRMQLQQWLFCASKVLTLAFPLCWAVLCYKSSQIRDTTPWKTMEKELGGCHTIISELLHHTRPGLWYGYVLIYILTVYLCVCVVSNFGSVYPRSAYILKVNSCQPLVIRVTGVYANRKTIGKAWMAKRGGSLNYVPSDWHFTLRFSSTSCFSGQSSTSRLTPAVCRPH